MKKSILSLIAMILFCSGLTWAAEQQLIHPMAIRPGIANTKKGYVVLILGPMSSGKTTISKRISYDLTKFLTRLKDTPEIVRIAEDEEMDGGIDRKLRLDFPGWTNEHIILFKKIIEQARQNKVVICDLLLYESSDYDITESFIRRLREKTNVFSTLVICSINKIVANTLHRNSSGQPFSRRSPDSVVDQYSEQLLSKSFDERYSQVVSCVTTREIEEGIELLSTSPALPSERQSREKCIRKLRELHSASPSPLRVPTDLYDFFIYNGGASLDDGIRNICWAIYRKICENDLNP